MPPALPPAMLLLAYASALRCVVSAAMPTLVCVLLLLPINVAASVSCERDADCLARCWPSDIATRRYGTHRDAYQLQPIGYLLSLENGWGQSGRLAFWGRIGGYRAIGGDIGKNGLRGWPQIDDWHVTRLPIPP